MIQIKESTKRFYRELWSESFTEKPKRRNERSEKFSKDSLGWGHFAKLKKDDAGAFIKDPASCKRYTARTFQTLESILLQDECIHWYVPNTFCTSKAYTEYREIKGEIIKTGGRRISMLRWINTIAIDIDIAIPVDELIKKIIKTGVGEPTAIHKTTRGYHIYWFLKERVPATPQNKAKFNNVMRTLQDVLNKEEEIMDKNAKDLVRYLQVPRNIIFENYNNKKEFSEWVYWSNKNKKCQVKTPVKRRMTKKEKNDCKRATVDGLIKKILSQGVAEGDRNKACFIVANYYRIKGYSKARTKDLLVRWNTNHGYNKTAAAHTNEQVINTVNSVYENKYNFQRKLLLDIFGVEVSKYIKHKQRREDRVNNHYTEYLKDIVYEILINEDYDYIIGSQREIAKKINIPLSSFQDVVKLIKEGKFPLLTIEVRGKGRYAKTIIKLNLKRFNESESMDLDKFIDKMIEPLKRGKEYHPKETRRIRKKKGDKSKST